MDGWIVGIIVAAVETALTTIVGLIIKAKWDKAKKEKEELEALREEKRTAEEAKRCNLVKQTVHEEIERLDEKVAKEFLKSREDFNAELQPICNDMDLMKKAMQKDIRRSLRQDGKDLIERGWATQLEKTEFDELYWAYHNLGKNGVVDALHSQIMQLPETKPTRKKQILNEKKK